MVAWRMIAAMASTVLAMPAAAFPLPFPHSLTQAVDPEIPCPYVELEPPPERPTPPEPPPHGPGEREIGGVALATAGLAVPPGVPDPPALTATAWLVADLDSGAVLGGCAPHEYRIPASTQKLLLMAAFLDDLDPAEEVEVIRQDLDIVPFSSAVGLVDGGVYTVETLWLGLMLVSGNDAANVLARLGGGEDGLAGGLQGMNDEARRLGAYQTHAATPSGLDGPGQFTSAYDLALIARPLFDRADFLRYAQTERTDIPAQRRANAGGFQIQNDNGLLLNYPGALGGKTGFTDLARHSFVGAAERGGRRLVVTVLGAERQPLVGWQQAAALLDWGFTLPAEAAVGRLVEPGELEELVTSSTELPEQPAAPAPGGGPPPARDVAAPQVGPLNAATVAGLLLIGGVTGLVLLLVASRRSAGPRARQSPGQRAGASTRRRSGR